jgi:hypothetical protein
MLKKYWSVSHKLGGGFGLQQQQQHFFLQFFVFLDIYNRYKIYIK